LSTVDLDQLRQVLTFLFDESEFLSPFGIRSLSAAYRNNPFELRIGGSVASVDYEPAESTTAMFGGNSNWRGPVWFPLNHLLVRALVQFHAFLGDDWLIEYPTGSGQKLHLGTIAADLRRRLISVFLADSDRRRPCFGRIEQMHSNPAWRDLIQFHEYFHGDNGAGLGASHQTGWTALVADLICRGGTPPDTAERGGERT